MATTITLPDRQDMTGRLRRCLPESHHLEQKLFPGILAHAGQPRVPRGMVLMLVLALGEYADDLTANGPVRNEIYNLGPQIIDALLDDAEFAAQTKALWESAPKS